MKISIYEHPLKALLKEKKIRLWMLQKRTGVPERRLSRYLNGIDPMPEQLAIDIYLYLIEPPEPKLDPVVEAKIREITQAVISTIYREKLK